MQESGLTLFLANHNLCASLTQTPTFILALHPEKASTRASPSPSLLNEGFDFLFLAPDVRFSVSSAEHHPHQQHRQAGPADLPALLSGPRAHRHGQEPGHGHALHRLR